MSSKQILLLQLGLGRWLLCNDLSLLYMYGNLVLPICIVKIFRRFYGNITGNQLPVHFPLFFTGARKHLQEPAETAG